MNIEESLLGVPDELLNGEGRRFKHLATKQRETNHFVPLKSYGVIKPTPSVTIDVYGNGIKKEVYESVRKTLKDAGNWFDIQNENLQ